MPKTDWTGKKIYKTTEYETKMFQQDYTECLKNQ